MASSGKFLQLTHLTIPKLNILHVECPLLILTCSVGGALHISGESNNTDPVVLVTISDIKTTALSVLRIRIQIGPVFRNFADVEPYSEYGFTQVKIG